MKIIKVLLVISLSLFLVGCGKSDSEEEQVKLNEASEVNEKLRRDIFNSIASINNDDVCYSYEKIEKFFSDNGYRQKSKESSEVLVKHIDDVGTFTIDVSERSRDKCKWYRISFNESSVGYQKADYNQNGYIEHIKFSSLVDPGGAVELNYNIGSRYNNEYIVYYSFYTHQFRDSDTLVGNQGSIDELDIVDSMNELVEVFTDEIYNMFNVDLNDIVYRDF